MTRRLLALLALGWLLTAAITTVATPAHAMTLDRVVSTIRDSGGHYAPRSATLKAADCSGLVSVAQTLGMGEPVHRLGSTRSLLAGQWPGAVPGASREDRFVIGTSRTHMVASVDGVNIEARSSGEPFRVGADARSPWDFPRQYHIDERLLIA